LGDITYTVTESGSGRFYDVNFLTLDHGQLYMELIPNINRNKIVRTMFIKGLDVIMTRVNIHTISDVDKIVEVLSLTYDKYTFMYDRDELMERYSLC